MDRNHVGILIVESEVDSFNLLKNVLEKVAPISFCIRAEDTDDALLKVVELSPDVVFLQYPLLGKTGSGFIKFIQIKLPGTSIVFVSNSKKYAIDAIHFEVYDYLLKPIDSIEIKNIIGKILEKKQQTIQSRIDDIIENKQDDLRLRLNSYKGLLIINPDDILYCKSDGSYTELHLTNRTVEISTQSLMKMQEILNPINFLRISRSIIINRNYIRRIIKGTCVFVLSVNGVEYEIKGSKTLLKTFVQFDFE